MSRTPGRNDCEGRTAIGGEQGLGPHVSRSWEDRNARSRDFGGMTTRVPDGVAKPNNVEEARTIVRSAAGEGVPLVIRGGGHSQGGQSLTDRGLVVDTSLLGRVQPLGPDLIRVQGGARWGSVVDALRGTPLLPRVLTDVAEVTVGGTLSAGGLGTTSHRHGLQIGQVDQLEVVTGTGELVRCSRTREPDLFNAVRGGQGQFGLITEAWIRLRRAGRRMRKYEFRYCDFGRFASDLEQIVKEDRFDRLRAEIRLHDRQIVLDAGIEYDEAFDDGKALAGLGFEEIAAIRDTGEVGYAGMYPRWAFSRKTCHPWRDWFLPWESLRVVLGQPWLDPRSVPRAPQSWIGIYPIRTQGIDAPLFMHPKGEFMFAYSILAVLGEVERASKLARLLQEVDAALVGQGGKGYLSGGVGYGREEWEQHYGEQLEMGIRWKREFDPKHVFRPEGMPFGARSMA